jgi:5'-nucleotidase
MRILLTNDDGLGAPGMAVLRDIASQLSDDVWMVAPETNQSGVSHSLTLHVPLRVRRLGAREMAVSGTPTDCVLMAVLELMDGARPDLVLSGVNQGQNAADDATYSGTIAGAMEGALLGIPSIALSQARHGGEANGDVGIRWETARTHGAKMITRLLAAGWPQRVLLNVNFPDCAPGEVRGVKVASQGHADPNVTLRYEKRLDMRGDPYFWLHYRRNTKNPPQGSDLAAIHEKYISVSPLHLDLTHYESCESLRRALGEEGEG